MKEKIIEVEGVQLNENSIMWIDAIQEDNNNFFLEYVSKASDFIYENDDYNEIDKSELYELQRGLYDVMKFLKTFNKVKGGTQ